MAVQLTEPNLNQWQGSEETLLPLPVPRGMTSNGTSQTNQDQLRKIRRPMALLSLAVVSGLVVQHQRTGIGRITEPSKQVPGVIAEPSHFALGRLEPTGRVVEVAAPEGGANARIKTMLANEGQLVRSGEVLAVLDNEDRLKSEMESSERQLALAQSRLVYAMKIAASGHDEARSALKIAEITQSRAERDRTKISRLYRSKAASLEEFDNAIQEAEIAALSLEANRAKFARFGASEGNDSVDVSVARVEIAVREAEVAEARTRLDQAYVRAPIAGSVLTIRLRAGEYVGQRAILDMGDTERMTARAEVYESIVRHLNRGKTVILRSSALESPLRGTLESISSVVRRQSIVDALPAANTDARVVEAIIVLDPESCRTAARYVGLQVRAEFRP